MRTFFTAIKHTVHASVAHHHGRKGHTMVHTVGHHRVIKHHRRGGTGELGHGRRRATGYTRSRARSHGFGF